MKIQEPAKVEPPKQQPPVTNGNLDEDILLANRQKLAQRMAGPKKKADKQ